MELGLVIGQLVEVEGAEAAVLAFLCVTTTTKGHQGPWATKVVRVRSGLLRRRRAGHVEMS